MATLADPQDEAVTGASYGGLKALCEAAAFDGFGDSALANRPGLLVGPHDPSRIFKPLSEGGYIELRSGRIALIKNLPARW